MFDLRDALRVTFFMMSHQREYLLRQDIHRFGMFGLHVIVAGTYMWEFTFTCMLDVDACLPLFKDIPRYSCIHMIRVCLHLCLCLGVQCVSESVYVYVSVYQFVNVIPKVNSGKLCMCVSDCDCICYMISEQAGFLGYGGDCLALVYKDDNEPLLHYPICVLKIILRPSPP